MEPASSGIEKFMRQTMIERNRLLINPDDEQYYFFHPALTLDILPENILKADLNF